MRATDPVEPAARRPAARTVVVPALAAAAPRPGPLARPAAQLALVLAVGAALRLRGLVAFPLEQDELYTVWESRDLFHVALEPGIAARPLYFLLHHLVLAALPATPLVLRALPFAFGLAGIWLTGRIATRVFGPAAGLTAAALLAFSPWHLHASGMARYWSLLYLAAAAAFLLLLRAYEEDRPALQLGALAALAVGGATHPTFLFPAAGFALALSLVRADGRLGWRWPSRGAWARLWLPFLALLGAAALALRLTGEESAVRNWGGRGLLATLRLLPGIVEWLTPTIALAGAMGAGLAVAAAASPRARAWGMGSLLGVLSTLVLLTVLSLRTDVYVDYAVSMLPLVFVSAGGLVQAGVSRLRSGRGAAAWIAAAALLAGVVPGTASHLSDGSRFDYRPAYRHVEATAPGLTVLTWPLIVQQHYAPSLRGVWLTMSPRFLDDALAREGDFWAVVSLRRYGIDSDDSGAVALWLDRHCSLEQAHERTRFDWRRYRVELWRCGAGRG